MEAGRHNINLSRQVWGELKLRAVQEGASASELIAFVIEKSLAGQETSTPLPRYQPRGDSSDRSGRTVFLPTLVWKAAREQAAQQGTSVSAWIDYQLRVYLGLLAENENATPPGKIVQVGSERVYLGENPIGIDLKSGKPKEP